MKKEWRNSGELKVVQNLRVEHRSLEGLGKERGRRKERKLKKPRDRAVSCKERVMSFPAQKYHWLES